MEFRILEYDIPHPETQDKFFVEMGEPYRERTWGPFYANRVTWNLSESFKTMNEAVAHVNDIKKKLPRYHYIK